MTAGGVPGRGRDLPGGPGASWPRSWAWSGPGAVPVPPPLPRPGEPQLERPVRGHLGRPRPPPGERDRLGRLPHPRRAGRRLEEWPFCPDGLEVFRRWQVGDLVGRPVLRPWLGPGSPRGDGGGRGVGELPVADGGGLGLEEALDRFQQPGGDVQGEGDAGRRSGYIVRPAKVRRSPGPPMPWSSMSIGPPSARYSRTNPWRVASIEWACSAVVVMVWCRSVGLPRLA